MSQKIWGYAFNPKTLLFSDDAGKPTEPAFTFQQPVSDTPFGTLTFLNPWLYATRATADIIWIFMKNLGTIASVSIVEVPANFVNIPQLVIECKGMNSVQLNCGLIASAIIRNGYAWAAQSVIAELKYNGVIF